MNSTELTNHYLFLMRHGPSDIGGITGYGIAVVNAVAQKCLEYIEKQEITGPIAICHSMAGRAVGTAKEVIKYFPEADVQGTPLLGDEKGGVNLDREMMEFLQQISTLFPILFLITHESATKWLPGIVFGYGEQDQIMNPGWVKVYDTTGLVHTLGDKTDFAPIKRK